MSSKTFPLLRVPTVVLTEVFKIMGPDIVLPLSFCSNRTHRLIKTYCGNSFPNMDLQHYYHLEQFKVRLETIPRDVLVELKNKIITSASFEECEIFCRNIDISEIEAAFGQEVPLNQKFVVPILRASLNPPRNRVVLFWRAIQTLAQNRVREYLEVYVGDYSIQIEKKKM